MTFARRFVHIGILLLGITVPCLAQKGLPPFAAFSDGPDQIDLGNLDIHVTMPLESKFGRGVPFVYNFSFDNSIWAPSGGTWVPAANFGFTTGVPAWNGVLTYSYSSGCQTYPYVGTICWSSTSNYVYTDAAGTVHTFSYWQECSSGCASGGSMVAADGSGYTISGSGVATPSGITVLPGNSGSITDSNGNHINASTNSGGYTTFTDTMNQTPLTINPIPSSNQTVYTVSGQPLYFMYQNYTVRTNFGCSGVSEFGPKTESLPIGMSFGDGTGFSITYEQTPGFPGDVTGRIAKLTLRTGGQITYTYPSANDGVICANGSSAGFTRQTPDGSWNYTRSESGTTRTTTIVDPQNNTTVMNFQTIYPTESQVSSPGGTLLKTVILCYNAAVPSGTPATCNSNAVSLPITERTVYTQWPNGGSFLESKVDTFYDSETAGSITSSYGLVKEVDEYGYGNNIFGALVRKTVTNYAGLGNNIVSRPSTVTVCSPTGSASACNSSGTVVAQTTYAYDQTGVTAPSGTSPQHNTVSGSRGNLTTVTYLTSGLATLTKTFSHFDTGMVNVASDVNGAQTSYSYPNATSTCGNALATSVSEPLGLTRATVWNCGTGSPASTTDENGATTTFGWSTTGNPYCYYYAGSCPTGVTDPLGNFTQITHTGQTSLESSLVFNSSSSTIDLLNIADGLGRQHFSQRKQSPSSTTYDSVETDYDSLGRPYRVTLPYAAASGTACTGGCPASITSYDALSRPVSLTDGGGATIAFTYIGNDVLVTAGPAPVGEGTKRKQLEYDALGRLTSVCEITAGTTAAPAGTCGQTSPQTGYWTTYSYDALNDLISVSENVQSSSPQSRSFAYDALRRMTSEINAETGNGTVYYFYDSDPGTKGGANCPGSFNGDLVKKVDSAGGVTCLTHDANRNLLSMTYPFGPNSGNTPSRYLVYGPASGAVTVNGVNMVNAKGRLAEAYTGNSKSTDIGFSYTARGQVSDVYESTPHSGGYYHVNQTYWANGALNQLSGLSGLPTVTYGVDGEGRIYSATASSGQNPLSSTSYNVAGLPTAITLGSSDSDSFQYDSNTNRLTQYMFNVSGQSVQGSLHWNALGTLGSLVITDPFNSTNTQTCTYTHDDLTRIASANCGTLANQTFSYDAFGNINKSGSPYSFQAIYNLSTNQMASIGGSAPTYDANGNVTNDFLHTYSWDANGRPVMADGVSLTYDALGRMIEQGRGSSYTEIAYAPDGAKLALMAASALQKGFVTLTGGAMAVYSSTGLDHYRHSDWLGSSRLGSTPSRAVLYDVAYAPFGEPYAQSGSPDLSFTGMNQDTASNLYDFPAREYGIQGRWPSPDPAGLAAVDPSDPQTWNRYSYVRNSPLHLVDPSGKDGLDYYDCEMDVSCGFIWEDFSGAGFGTTYTFDGAPLSAAAAASLLGNPDAGVVCPGPCEGFGTNAAGQTAYCQFYAFAGGVSGCFNPADLTNGINEANGKIYTDAGFAQFEQAAIDQQRWNLALVIAGATGQDPATVYSQLVYRNTKGGNANFSFSGDVSSLFPNCPAGGEGSACRYDPGPSIHFVGIESNTPVLHLDAGNPFSNFPLGVFMHLGDILGEINSSIPFGTPGP